MIHAKEREALALRDEVEVVTCESCGLDSEPIDTDICAGCGFVICWACEKEHFEAPCPGGEPHG